jgi:hypothetical protein
MYSVLLVIGRDNHRLLSRYDTEAHLTRVQILINFFSQAFFALVLSLFLEIQKLYLIWKHVKYQPSSDRVLPGSFWPVEILLEKIFMSDYDSPICPIRSFNSHKRRNVLQNLGCPLRTQPKPWHEIAKKLLIAGSDSQSIIGKNQIIYNSR